MTCVVSAGPPARRPDTRDDGLRAAYVLATAFARTELASWLLRPVDLPEVGMGLRLDERNQLLRRIFLTEVGYYRTFGGLLVIGDGEVRSVAAWLLSEPELTDQDQDSAKASRRDRLERISAPVGRRLLAMEDANERHRPPAPRIHLAYLATSDSLHEDRDHQVLLGAFHQLADKAGVTACTETLDDASVPWLVERGWTSGEPYKLPDGGPHMRPLDRLPQPCSAD